MNTLDLADMYRECSGLYLRLIDFFAAYPGYKKDLKLLACAIDSCMRDLLDEILKEGK